MTTLTSWRFATVALASTVGITVPLAAQNLVDRVQRVREGQVRMTVSLKPGVCGYGTNIMTYRGNERTRTVSRGDRVTRDVEYDVDCEPGPGRLVLDVDGGEVVDVRFYVGGRWRPSSTATDMGAVPARDAAQVLLHLANTANGKAGQKAIFPLTVIDSVEVWRDLMRIARNEDRPRQVRKDAVFWLGQMAEEPATRGLSELVGEAAADREVRESAIFALSQRPKDEGIPALINVVRTNRDPELRKKALFWLGQSGDRRALELIEELLAKK